MCLQDYFRKMVFFLGTNIVDKNSKPCEVILQGFSFRNRRKNKMSRETKIDKKQNKKSVFICKSCGVELTDDNCRGQEAFCCIDCESKDFEELERENGTSLALYLACSRFDVPLYPLLLHGENGKLKEDFENSTNKWVKYIQILEDSGKMYVNERLARFMDGEHYLLRIFGRGMSEKNFGAFVINERNKIALRPGTEEQRNFWGERDIWQNLPVSTEIYNELDKRYETRMSRLRGVPVDDQLEDTQKKLCKMLLAQDHLLSLGDVTAVDKLQKVIDSIQASEQLRRKDEKPMDELRIDQLVLSLENAGLMENGELLDYDDLVVALRDNLIKSKKYEYSLDVADQVVLDIHNSMRSNADLMPLIDLPEELELVDEYGEFEPEETEQEKEAKRYLGLTKVQFERKETKPVKKKRSVKKNA